MGTCLLMPSPLVMKPWIDTSWPDLNGSPTTRNVPSINHRLQLERRSSCSLVAKIMCLALPFSISHTRKSSHFRKSLSTTNLRSLGSAGRNFCLYRLAWRARLLATGTRGYWNTWLIGFDELLPCFLTYFKGALVGVGSCFLSNFQRDSNTTI